MDNNNNKNKNTKKSTQERILNRELSIIEKQPSSSSASIRSFFKQLSKKATPENPLIITNEQKREFKDKFIEIIKKKYNKNITTDNITNNFDVEKLIKKIFPSENKKTKSNSASVAPPPPPPPSSSIESPKPILPKNLSNELLQKTQSKKAQLNASMPLKPNGNTNTQNKSLSPSQQSTTISNAPLSPSTVNGIQVTVSIQGKNPTTFTVTPRAKSSGGKRKSHKQKHHKKSHTRRHMRKKSHRHH